MDHQLSTVGDKLAGATSGHPINPLRKKGFVRCKREEVVVINQPFLKCSLDVYVAGLQLNSVET